MENQIEASIAGFANIFSRYHIVIGNSFLWFCPAKVQIGGTALLLLQAKPRV